MAIEKSKEGKKTRILFAAKECLARFGFEKTTLDDIGKIVGLNKASLYYYYPNKEAIFSEVIVNESEEFLQALQKRVIKVKLCRRKIIVYLIERLRYYQNVVTLHNISVEVLQTVQPVFHRLYEDVLDKEVGFIGSILKQGIEKSEFIACDTDKVARSILTISDAIKHRAWEASNLQPRAQIDYSKVEDELEYTISLILNGLKR